MASSSDAASTTDPSSSVRSPHSRTCLVSPVHFQFLAPDGVLVDFEYSIHSVPSGMKREIRGIFPTLDLSSTSDLQLLCLPTFQRTSVSLTEFTVESEKEKNRLLQTFQLFSKLLCDELRDDNSINSSSHWCDWIDPCSGLPAQSSHGSQIYSEVDGAQLLLRYRTEQAGFCSLILHPKWGAACYPASLFTTAPVDRLNEALQAVRRSLEGETQSAASSAHAASVPVSTPSQSAAESESASTSSLHQVHSDGSCSMSNCRVHQALQKILAQRTQ